MGPFDERLRNTIDRWNADFEAGQDTLFGRSADTMYSVSEPPFYALRLYPTMFNTQGGAERNEKAQVLDLEGNPIPHLYSAGEFGSLFSSNYSGGCNIGECVMYGRIAGEQVSVAPRTSWPTRSSHSRRSTSALPLKRSLSSGERVPGCCLGRRRRA